MIDGNHVQMSQPRNKRLGLASPPRALVAHLANARVLRQSELTALIKTFHSEWTLAKQASVETLVDWMLQTTRLRQFTLHAEVRSPTTRYVWGDVSPLEIASSLASTGYFCHATAASLHGLLTYNPETIYLNREQSAKPVPEGPLSQEGIDRAFSKKQRASRDVYYWGTTRVAILCGKNSGRLEVQSHPLTGQHAVDVTGIERTLIDLTVRPDYAGGPAQVLEAFRRSRGRISVQLLLKTLQALAYRYPYHQAIGFYMQRAGYGENDLAKFSALDASVDFYVGYGIAERDFDTRWRVHVPKNL